MALEWLSKHTTHMQRECRNDCLDDTNVLRHKTHPYVNTMHSCSEQMTRECIADSLTYPLFVYKMIRKTEYTSIISTNNKISRVTTLQTMWNAVTIPWHFPDGLRPMLSVTHIMPVLVLLSAVGVGMQKCMIWNQNEMHKFTKVQIGRKYAAKNKQF